ncbi:CdaR family protein [Halalkalibacter oceani]|uniref:CdaR family protein n=1 Tax=Halalkalibacter oceani TaxID=1653776 RepID=A0A9X2DTC7_9BACI|nr:CdaR family protein [Halalkalibacter oceani]MCM3716087.1 CdaR family protein [Halalkalibacter oceani]
MDRLFNSHWFVKIISFFIALMLFTMVNLDDLTSQPGVLPTISPATYTLEEVELSVLYDEENYAVIDQTESVRVNLRGPQSEIMLFQLTRPTYEVFVDVSEREEGVHTLNVQHRGFPEELTVSIVPQFARVELQEKQTISLPVEVELLHAEEVTEGYTVGTPIVNPINVDVRAARSIVSQVDSAKVFIDVAGADKMIEETGRVTLYQANGEEIELEPEPSVVDVRVPITSPNREVPVRVGREGELPEGLSIQEVRLEPGEVTVYGPLEIIDQLQVIELGNLNLNEITESGSYEWQVPVPPGVEQVSPEVVTVTVTVDQEQERELANVPIEIVGLADGQTATLAEAPTAVLIAYGTAEIVEQLDIEDIQAYIDISNFQEGEHEAELQINGPSNVRFQPVQATIPVIIRNDVIEGENE